MALKPFTPAPVVAPVIVPAPANHRADAAQAFMQSWLPAQAVAATAFKAADAEALLAAIDAAGT
jgi:predicted amidophosphoribosyltransferase